MAKIRLQQWRYRGRKTAFNLGDKDLIQGNSQVTASVLKGCFSLKVVWKDASFLFGCMQSFFHHINIK